MATLEWSRYYRLLNGALGVLHGRSIAHRFPIHEHEYSVIGLVGSGSLTYRYRGARYDAAAGDVFLIDAGAPHSGEAAGPDGYLYFMLHPSAELLAGSFKASTVADARLASMLWRCHHAIAQRFPAAECESLALKAIAHAAERYMDAGAIEPETAHASPAICGIREYIDGCFTEDLSLAQLASRAALSPYHFARIFEREVGLPPHAYVDSVRIRNARSLLNKGEPASTVAHAVGYADQSHFTHRFKRHVGVTPGQYVRNTLSLAGPPEEIL